MVPIDCGTGGPAWFIAVGVPPLALFCPLAVIGLGGNDAEAGGIGSRFSPLPVEAGVILGLMSGFVSASCVLSFLPLPPPPPPSALSIALVEGLMSLALGLVGSRILVPSSGIRSAYKLSSGASSVGP